MIQSCVSHFKHLVTLFGCINSSLFLLQHLTISVSSVSPEFHGLEEWMLLRSLQALQTDGKAEIITMDDGKGVKFF